MIKTKKDGVHHTPSLHDSGKIQMKRIVTNIHLCMTYYDKYITIKRSSIDGILVSIPHFIGFLHLGR